jgi:hypothetical protein
MIIYNINWHIGRHLLNGYSYLWFVRYLNRLTIIVDLVLQIIKDLVTIVMPVLLALLSDNQI